MSDIAIRVEGLSKQYRIGARQERYKALRDSITEAMAAPFRRAASLLRGQATGAAELNETIWALRDVSFEVKQGEVIGVIGRNGAGKSTLLKILSRITEPTKGYAEIYGRVGSLLEVGTGFHPELTGRENIFLNGAILGMRRREIERKFDEIVAFAEIEKFIDTPVKHYSSGMYMRLAFAVAAHMESEILLIDEVLAVGDVAFQNKCLEKIGKVAKAGKTVIFVSHNLTAVTALCRRGVMLDSGEVIKDCEVSRCVSHYINHLLHADSLSVQKKQVEYGFRQVAIRNLNDPEDLTPQVIHVPGRYAIEFYCRLPKTRDINLGFTLVNEAEIPVASSCIRDSLENVPGDDVCLWIEIPVSVLRSGNYRIEGAIWDSGRKYHQSSALAAFSVVNPLSSLDVNGSTPRGATLIDRPWHWRSIDSQDVTNCVKMKRSAEELI